MMRIAAVFGVLLFLSTAQAGVLTIERSVGHVRAISLPTGQRIVYLPNGSKRFEKFLLAGLNGVHAAGSSEFEQGVLLELSAPLQKIPRVYGLIRGYFTPEQTRRLAGQILSSNDPNFSGIQKDLKKFTQPEIRSEYFTQTVLFLTLQYLSAAIDQPVELKRADSGRYIAAIESLALSYAQFADRTLVKAVRTVAKEDSLDAWIDPARRCAPAFAEEIEDTNRRGGFVAFNDTEAGRNLRAKFPAAPTLGAVQTFNMLSPILMEGMPPATQRIFADEMKSSAETKRTAYGDSTFNPAKIGGKDFPWRSMALAQVHGTQLIMRDHDLATLFQDELLATRMIVPGLRPTIFGGVAELLDREISRKVTEIEAYASRIYALDALSGCL